MVHHVALSLILSLSLAAAGCGEGSGEAPGADDAPGAIAERTAAPPDLSYPGEEPAPAVPESPAEAVPPEPSVPPPLQEVGIFLVELGEGGGEAAETPRAGDTFGCGDRLRAVEVPVASEGEPTEGRIAAAVGSLLEASGGQGLYTAFERSQLEVERVEAVAGVEGFYRVHLTGQLRLGGVCDNPRVRAQLEATARQFEGVDDVEISIDGKPLESFLSGR